MTDTRQARGCGRVTAASAWMFIGLWLVAAAGCGGVFAPRLEHAAASKEAVAQAAVDALARQDHGALAELAVSEREFRQVIWPRLPASQPGVGMPVDYVWNDTATKSRAHLGRAIAARGGRAATVEAVIFRGASTDYDGITVHRETEIRLREADGTVTEQRLFGAMIDAGGRWKVYSYIVD